MTTPRSAAQEIAPKMAELSANVLFGDIWERPELSKRDRSLITVAALVALYRTGQLRGHIGRALDNGVTREGNRRGNHPYGLLRWLAHGGQRRRNSQRGFRRSLAPRRGERS